VIKSPKVYLADSGLACHLLGIETQAELEKSPFLGVLFEGFIASEILKAQVNSGRRGELYYFRDQQGLEVDFVLPVGGGTIRLVEVKATHTPTLALAAPMQRVAQAMLKSRCGQVSVQPVLVHRRALGFRSPALVTGTRAMAWPDFVKAPLAVE